MVDTKMQIFFGTLLGDLKNFKYEMLYSFKKLRFPGYVECNNLKKLLKNVIYILH